ncbi:MAG: hypothetical protein ABI687_00815 [Flavitalea sp.]
MAAAVSAITFYYYRLFFLKLNKENIHFRHLSLWIIAMVAPFFLLLIFSVLGMLHITDESIAPYLFSVFSGIIIFSILLRPKFLNSAGSLNDLEESKPPTLSS